LEDKNYEVVISETRGLIESYHKHLLKIDKIDNKQVLGQVFSTIEIIPDKLREKDSKIADGVLEIVSSLNSIIKSLGELRNNPLISLSHGLGPGAIYLGESHAYLIVGSALAYMTFISKSKRRNI
jgi:hypothetical protein